MDKFVNLYREQLQQNPNATNHLTNPNTRNTTRPTNQISNYFTIKPKNKSNSISIDCSSDEDDDIQIINDDKNEDIQLLLSRNRNRNRNRNKMKQKTLTQFLKTTDEIMEEKQEKQLSEYDVNNYLFVPPLMNERHLFELSELCGLRNNGSSQRLKQMYFSNIYNINTDILYRRHLYLIINNDNLHRLPIKHPLDQKSDYTQLNFDYISSIKFDDIGSLFAACSTNGKIEIFDFDNFISKWNMKIRMKYNNDIIKLKKNRLENAENNENENENEQENIDSNIGAASLNNIKEIEINTGFKIEDLEWNQHNMNEISVCGHNGGSLNIYDLRRVNNKPICRLKSNKYHPLLTNKYSSKNNKFICAGDRMGNVYYWDLRKNNKNNKNMLKFNPISTKQTSLIGGAHTNAMTNNMNLRNFAVKHLHFTRDGNVLYIVRENGFIQIIDLRKNGYVYKNIDLWRCSLVDSKDRNNNSKYRARIDDGIILESMNSALLKLENNSLVNIHLESETIRKTYSFQKKEEELINVSFLSKVMQRRMCSFEHYGMPQMIVTGTFNKEMISVDMSSEFDMYQIEKEYKQKRFDLGLIDKHNLNNEHELENKYDTLYENNAKSYGFMASSQLTDIMTCCSLHPKLLYTVCGTLNNCLEIVACASNPF